MKPSLYELEMETAGFCRLIRIMSSIPSAIVCYERWYSFEQICSNERNMRLENLRTLFAWLFGSFHFMISWTIVIKYVSYKNLA